MYFAHRSSGRSAPLNAHMIGVHIGFCAHVIHISHYPGSHHVCCHYFCLVCSGGKYLIPLTSSHQLKRNFSLSNNSFSFLVQISFDSFQLKNLGKPTVEKSTVFLNIVQKAFDPPPIPPLLEHLSYFAGGVFYSVFEIYEIYVAPHI